jgi:hypothetical protein
VLGQDEFQSCQPKLFISLIDLLPGVPGCPNASGLLGVAAVEKFLSAGWEEVGVSRRKPELAAAGNLSFCGRPEGQRSGPRRVGVAY